MVPKMQRFTTILRVFTALIGSTPVFPRMTAYIVLNARLDLVIGMRIERPVVPNRMKGRCALAQVLRRVFQSGMAFLTLPERTQ